MNRAIDDLLSIRDLPPLQQAAALRWVRAVLSVVLSLLHIGFGSVCLLRPDLFVIYPVWSGFDEIAPTAAWGWLTVGTGLLLLFTRGVWVMLMQFISASVMAAITIIISARTGVNTGTPTYGILGLISLMTFYLTVGPWLSRQEWFSRLQARVQRRRHG